MTIRDLTIGDRFISASDKGKRNPVRYELRSRPMFNLTAGTATVECWDETNQRFVIKQARLEVVKLPLKQRA